MPKFALANLSKTFAAVLALAGALAIQQAPAAPPPGYWLVWADEFNGSSLDTTKWGNWLLGPRRDAVNVANAVSVGGGYLTITTYTSGGVHYTGMISTDGKFRARYGYLEASIDFNDSPGMWSAFWLQSPTMGSYIGDPSTAGAEIDDAEHRSTDGTSDISGQVQSNIHWDGYGSSARSAGSGNYGSGLGSGFHTYGFNWTAANYQFLVDGTSRWTTTSGHSDRTEFFILSSEVDDTSTTWAGLIPAGGYGDLTTSTTKLVVDYVRYYAPTSYVFWTGASSALWTDTGNWVSNLAPVSASDAVFSYLSSGNFSTTLGQDLALHSLAIWEASSVSINGNTLTLGAGGIDMVSANNNATINSAVSLSAAQTWKVGPSRTLTLNGNLSGSASLSKGSYGTLILGGTNDFAGTLNVDTGSSSANDGALRITRNAAIANAASPIPIRNNNSGSSTFQLDGTLESLTVTQDISLAGRNVTGAAIENLAGSNTIAGNLSLVSGGANYWIQSDSGTLTWSGLLPTNTLGGSRTLTFTGNGNQAVPGLVQNGSGGGTVNLTKSGTGTLLLQSSNTFSGTTRVSAGVLRLDNSNALQNSMLDLNGADSGRLDFSSLTMPILGGLTGLRDLWLTNGSGSPVALVAGNNNQYSDYGGALRGPGNLTKIGFGTFTLSGTNSYTGQTTINAGTLRLAPNTNLIASLQPLVRFTFDSVSGTTILNAGTGGAAMNGVRNGTGATITSSGRYGNALSLNGDGSSIRITNRVTSFDGSTAGVSWTLAMWLKTSQAGAGYAYQGDASWVSGNTAFYLNQGNTSAGTRVGAVRYAGGWLTGNAAVNDNNWHFITITDNGGAKVIYVDGLVDASFLGLVWPNTSVGNQVWIGGTADTGDGVAKMNGLIDEVYIFSRALSQVEVQTIMSNQPVACAACYVGQLPATTPVTIAPGAMLDLNGISQTIASLSDAAAGGGTLANNSASPLTLTLQYNSGGVATFSGGINDSGVSGALGLVKAGNSTQILAGMNSYHGPTTVAGGTLQINGSLVTSTVTVTGGTLAGNGYIGGPVSVQPGGTFTPGGSLSTLTISNSLSLAGTTSIELNHALATNDSVRGLASITYGGTLSLTNLAGTLAPGDSFKLFDSSNYNGSFASLNPPAPGIGLVWNTSTLGTDGTLRIGYAPPAINAVAFDGTNLAVSGTNGLPNGTFSVLSSTNLTLPLANWPVVATGTFNTLGAFGFTNPVDKTSQQSFFLLRQP